MSRSEPSNATDSSEELSSLADSDDGSESETHSRPWPDGPAVPATAITSLLQECALSVRALLSAAPPSHLSRPPSPLEFMRLVHAGRPAVIHGVLAQPGWERVPELELRSTWTRLLAGNSKQGKVQVSVTPDGRADSLCGTLFALPKEEDMDVGAALDAIADMARPLRPGEQRTEIRYIQSQDNNLHGDFAPFLGVVVPPTLDFAEEALARPPDAANLWLGAQVSTTSLHKDPYDNVYVVLRGRKQFTLLPPLTWIPETDADVARWDLDGAEWKLRSEEPRVTVPWATVDFDSPESLRRYPWLKPMRVTIGPGEALYLPSQWWHAVSQVSPEDEPDAPPPDPERIAGTLAVNFWFDMEYGLQYESLRLVENLSRLVREAVTTD
ncbi:cupin-like domain-containing protein [Hyaloraphidium curvatum]|nr:cupin-like domain-containing protein [Hyaloraphidium curvatum]